VDDRRIKRKVSVSNAFILFLSLILTSGYSVECQIGGENIIIPGLEGFTAASSVSGEIVTSFAKFTPPSNRLIEAFITPDKATQFLLGESVQFDQYLRVSTLKQAEQLVLSRHEFRDIKTGIREAFESKLDSAMMKAGDILSNINNEINMAGYISLGIDYEAANSITASMLLKTVRNTEQGDATYLQAATMTTLLTKGKILYLNVYRDYKHEDDIAWTRSTARKWAEKILSANETVYPLSSDIVPKGTLISSTTKELLAGDMSEYSTKDHAKSQGVDISLKYPAIWKREEGIRPHIVQKFTGIAAENISVSCMIIIQDFPLWASMFLDGDDGSDLFYESIRELVPPNATYMDSGKTRLDGESAVWVKFNLQLERAGLSATVHCLQYALLYHGKMISIQCDVAGLAADKEITEDAFISYLPVFQTISNSLVINNKWAVLSRYKSNKYNWLRISLFEKLLKSA